MYIIYFLIWFFQNTQLRRIKVTRGTNFQVPCFFKINKEYNIRNAVCCVNVYYRQTSKFPADPDEIIFKKTQRKSPVELIFFT